MRLVPNNNWLESLTDEVLKDPFFRKNTVPAVMKTDIREKEEGYFLNIELPGFRKEDIKMELEDGYLTISAVRAAQESEEAEMGRLVRQERVSGSCTRTYYIGDEITVEDIRAKYENGELKVFVPKKDPKAVETKKTITIE